MNRVSYGIVVYYKLNLFFMVLNIFSIVIIFMITFIMIRQLVNKPEVYTVDLNHFKLKFDTL